MVGKSYPKENYKKYERKLAREKMQKRKSLG
jgi:hypothetical protein